MKFLKGLLLSILLSALSTQILVAAVLAIIGSPTLLNTSLKQAGLYEEVAVAARQGIGSSQRIPVSYQSQFTTAVNKAISVEVVEQIFQPALVDISTWVEQPSTVPPPDIILTIRPAKENLIKELQTSGLSAVELAVFQADLSRQVPDQIRLSAIGGLTGTDSPATPSPTEGLVPGKPSAPSPATQTDQITPALKLAKQVSQALQLAYTISLWVVLASIGLLLILGRRDGRKALTRPAVPILIQATILMLVGIIGPKVLAANLFKFGPNQAIISGILTQFLVQLPFAALPWFVAAAIGCAIAWFIRDGKGPLATGYKPIKR